MLYELNSVTFADIPNLGQEITYHVTVTDKEAIRFVIYDKPVFGFQIVQLDQDKGILGKDVVDTILGAINKFKKENQAAVAEAITQAGISVANGETT